MSEFDDEVLVRRHQLTEPKRIRFELRRAAKVIEASSVHLRSQREQNANTDQSNRTLLSGNFALNSNGTLTSLGWILETETDGNTKRLASLNISIQISQASTGRFSS
jgi:hypothetical protein